MQRLFGKELLVLLWAVELPDVKPEEIAVAIRNWHGLKPEERWWLYTMTAAATGLAHQAGMGWRGALAAGALLRHALGRVPPRRRHRPRHAGAAGQCGLRAAEEEVEAEEDRRSGLPFRRPVPAE